MVKTWSLDVSAQVKEVRFHRRQGELAELALLWSNLHARHAHVAELSHADGSLAPSSGVCGGAVCGGGQGGQRARCEGTRCVPSRQNLSNCRACGCLWAGADAGLKAAYPLSRQEHCPHSSCVWREAWGCYSCVCPHMSACGGLQVASSPMPLTLTMRWPSLMAPSQSRLSSSSSGRCWSCLGTFVLSHRVVPCLLSHVACFKR